MPVVLADTLLVCGVPESFLNPAKKAKAKFSRETTKPGKNAEKP